MNYHEFKGVPIPPEGLEVDFSLRDHRTEKCILIAVKEDRVVLFNSLWKIFIHSAERCSLPKKKVKKPMSPTTCPKFPWAFRRFDWTRGTYVAVLETTTHGVATANYENGTTTTMSWEDLMWYETIKGEPLYVEVYE